MQNSGFGNHEVRTLSQILEIVMSVYVAVSENYVVRVISRRIWKLCCRDQVVGGFSKLKWLYFIFYTKTNYLQNVALHHID